MAHTRPLMEGQGGRGGKEGMEGNVIGKEIERRKSLNLQCKSYALRHATRQTAVRLASNYSAYQRKITK